MDKEGERRLTRFLKTNAGKATVGAGIAAAFALAAGAYIILKRSHEKKAALTKAVTDIENMTDGPAALVEGTHVFSEEMGADDFKDITAGIAENVGDEKTQVIFQAMNALASDRPQSTKST